MREKENESEVLDLTVPETRAAEAQVPLGLQSLQLARSRAKIIAECRQLAVNETEAEDWYDYGGNPGMDVGAAERIRVLFGLQSYDLNVNREERIDSKGEFYIYIVTGRIGNSQEQMEILGSQTSRKAFYAKSQGLEIESCDVNEANVMKDAISNWWVNAVSRFLGLRGLTWEKLEKMSDGRIAKNKAKSIDFKSSKSERSDENTDKASDIWGWLLEINGQSVQTAKNQLKALTAFTSKDGKEFKGYSDINKVSDKVLPRLYGAVKKLYADFGGNDQVDNDDKKSAAGKSHDKRLDVIRNNMMEINSGNKKQASEHLEVLLCDIKSGIKTVDDIPADKIDDALAIVANAYNSWKDRQGSDNEQLHL